MSRAFFFAAAVPEPEEVLRLASKKSGRRLHVGAVEETLVAGLGHLGPIRTVRVEILDLAPDQYGTVLLMIADREHVVEVVNNVSTTRDVFSVASAVNDALAELGGESWTRPGND